MNIFFRFAFAGEDCEFEIRVRRNTVYETSIGEELRINCTVIFCNNSPPTVSWFKLGESVVPVNVSSSNHIKTEWKKIDDSQGISFLVFKKIRMSDSGEYQCQGGGSMGHNINVSVSGESDYLVNLIFNQFINLYWTELNQKSHVHIVHLTFLTAREW